MRGARPVVLLVVLFVLSAGAVAVLRSGSSGSGSGPGGPGSTAAPASSTTTTTTTSLSVPARRGRGTLRVGVTPLGSLDPAQARTPEQLLVADQLFDSLTAYDPETLVPVPSLAARWEATPDLRQWTFVLRPGAQFANGRPVRAADVKYSFERAARRGSGSPGAELLRVVSGYADFRAAGAPGLAGVVVVADATVRLVLDEPFGELASVVASPVLAVVPQESVEAQAPVPAFSDEPVGSGPFRVVSRDGAVLTMVPADGARTGVARLEVVSYQTQGAAYRAFTQGELDWARVPPEESEAAARRYGEEAFRPYVASLFYAFNLASPKLADARFREAIVRAIDRRAVAAAVYQGTVRAADGIVGEGVPGHQAGACRRCAHSPERSRELVAAVFGAGGQVPGVGLDFDDEPTQAAVARAIQASLGEVGIPVALRPRPAASYDQFALSGDREVFRLEWVPGYPSPEAFLSPLFLSGSANNLAGFSDPGVDALLGAARAEPDARRRLARYQEAERAILDRVPVIPIAQLELQAVVAERVRGLEMTSLGTFDAAAVTVEGRP
ncbi:MAG: ABC transporter substrate-binding protein [Acidimicrobiales bacterium]